MSSYYNECPHCGRSWRVPPERMRSSAGTGWTGFLRLPIENHIQKCGRRTPAERRAANRRDKKRWERQRPRTIIRNNPAHPGLKDDLDTAERDLQKVGDWLLGTPGTIQRVLERLGLEGPDPDEVVDDLVGINIEQCPSCDWWFESHELVDNDGNIVGCDQCRDD